MKYSLELKDLKQTFWVITKYREMLKIYIGIILFVGGMFELFDSISRGLFVYACLAICIIAKSTSLAMDFKTQLEKWKELHPEEIAEYEIKFNNELVITDLVNGLDFATDLKDIVKTFDTKNSIIFYTKAFNTYTIPKRFLSQEEIKEILEFIKTEKIPYYNYNCKKKREKNHEKN